MIKLRICLQKMKRKLRKKKRNKLMLLLNNYQILVKKPLKKLKPLSMNKKLLPQQLPKLKKKPLLQQPLSPLNK